LNDAVTRYFPDRWIVKLSVVVLAKPPVSKSSVSKSIFVKVFGVTDCEAALLILAACAVMKETFAPPTPLALDSVVPSGKIRRFAEPEIVKFPIWIRLSTR
jgi:hypothetical protein